MFCEKCGSVIADGALSCGNCGAPVMIQPQDTAVQSDDQVQSFAPQFDDQLQETATQFADRPMEFAPQFDDQPQDFAPQFDEQPEGLKNGKKTKNKKLMIALIAGGVVLLAGLIVLLVILFTRKPTMAELEKKCFHESLESFVDSLEIDNATYSVRLEPGQYLKDLADSEGIDISWLNSMDFDFILDSGEERSGFGAKFALNGTEIGALSALFDQNSNELLLDMKGFSDSVGLLDLKALDLTSLSAAASIDKSKTVKLIEKYYDMIFDSIDNVKESKGDFTANGVSEKCRILTADISQRKAMEIVKKILEEAQNDEELKDFVLALYKTGAFGADYTADEVYQMMQEGIQNALDSVSPAADNASDATVVTLVDYVSDNKIIGRTIKSGVEITLGNAHDGKKFGTVLSVNGKDYLLGGGTQNGSILNGDIVIYGYGDNAELATLTLTNYDYEEDEGSVELSLSKSAWEMITRDSSLAATLALISAKIERSGDSVIVDFLAGKEHILKATLTKRPEHSVEIDPNLKKIDFYDWIDSIDFNVPFDRLVDAGVPERILLSLYSSVKPG